MSRFLKASAFWRAKRSQVRAQEEEIDEVYPEI